MYTRMGQLRWCLCLIVFLCAASGCDIDWCPGDDNNTTSTTSQPPASQCTACHGSDNNSAPPIATDGSSDTSDVRVGAHQSHLRDGELRTAVPCESCHTVPDTVAQQGHIDPSPAEITWSDLAQSTGLHPVWDRESATCSNTYCHGASLSGGSNREPVWNVVDGSQAACGTCHGNPPPAPHPSSNTCRSCHELTIAEDGAIDTAGGRHLDGEVQFSPSAHPEGWDDGSQHGYAFYAAPDACRSCHGSDYTGGTSGVSCDACHTGGTAAWRTDCIFCHGGLDNVSGAPPYSVYGAAGKISAGVGAHSAHVQEAALHSAYDCSVCHVKPSSFDSPGHIDGLAGAEVVFSGIAGAAAYNASTATCSSVYCHGSGLQPSGALAWTSPAAMTCASCHGYYSDSARLSGGHSKHLSESFTCAVCHNKVIADDGSFVDKRLHINSTADVATSYGTYNQATHTCSVSCHEPQNWFEADDDD